MTPDQAAALIWALGTGWFARALMPGYRRFLASDPLVMCDECRERRRTGNVLLSGLPPALEAVALIAAAAAWPVMFPARLIVLAVKGRHRCDRAVPADS